MQKRTKVLLVAAFAAATLSLFASPAAADSYLTLNAGAYVPGGDVDDLDPGPTVNLVYGFTLLPMVWGEVGAGYARAEKDDTELEVIPLTLNAKLRFPIPVVKPYLLAGVGAYRVAADDPAAGTDDDIALGYQAAAGVDFKILLAKVSLEVEYFQTESDLYGRTLDVEGVLATVGVGIEF